MKGVRIILVGGLAVTAWLTVESAESAVGPSGQPNVVLIMTDDQGQWANGCYGNREILTPNIDRLAAGGVMLRRAFVCTPVCSPSRATFLSGRIPSQHGIHEWISRENIGESARSLVEDELLLSEILAQSGYRCGISGKWHLGDSLRRQKGFEDWFVMPTGGSRYQNAPMIRNGKVQDRPGYLTEVITDGAIGFLESRDERPFFLFVSYNAPHTPYGGHPQSLVDLYATCAFETLPREAKHSWASALTEHLHNRASMQRYFAAVTGIDAGVGRIIAELDALGLREETLVIFTSDHGFMCGHHGLWGKGNCSSPRNMYDESMLVPLIFSQPGRLDEGRVMGEMTSSYDLLPTLLEYLQIELPQQRNLPGRSYAALLAGRGAEWDNVVYGEYGSVRMIRTERWKYVHRYPEGPHELYDLKRDAGEQRNLAGVPDHETTAQRLKGRLEDWFARYAVPEKDPVGVDGDRKRNR